MSSSLHIGLYTSGGDAPGMNAAIRSVVRSALHHNAKVTGIQSGYVGMLKGDFESLDLRSVANVIQRGGTFLKTARSQEFLQKENRKKNRQENGQKIGTQKSTRANDPRRPPETRPA